MRTAPAFLLILAAATAAVVPGCRTARGSGDVGAVGGDSLAVGDSLAIEVAAARYLLRRHSGVRVTIDPAYASTETRSGAPTHGLRPPDRSAELAATVGAVVSGSRERGGVHLILSEPLLAGGSARMVVTLIAPDLATAGLEVETYSVSLAKNGSAWEVTNAQRRLG